MTNPEQHALDEIDQLMAQGLDEHGVPLDDYTKERYVKCELCQGSWHGLPRRACPGPYATPEQRKNYVERPTTTGEYMGCVTTRYEGIVCAVHLYRDGGGFVGLLQPLPDQELDSPNYSFDEAHASFTLHAFEAGFELPIMLVPQDNPGIARFPDTP